MTKEELEKEAREKAKKRTKGFRCQDNCEKSYVMGALDFAEPREKRIAELEKENSKLILGNKSLSEKLISVTREELEKEARKDVDSLNGVDLVSSTMIAIDKYGAYKIGRYDGYLAGAESREKRIAELDKKLAIVEQDREHNDYELTEVYKKIAELEAQIEKMKCCGNCRFSESDKLNGTFCHREGCFVVASAKCKLWDR